MERILIIDDEPSSNVAVKLELRKLLPDVHIIERDFSDGLETAARFLPHIVILDLIKGDPAEGEDLGLTFYKDIWEKKCCPTIIHSARADDFNDQFETHPLLKKVKKGSKAELQVVAAVKEFNEVLSTLKSVEERLHHALSRFLVRGLDRISKHSSGSSKILEYCALRHVAASIDDPKGEARFLKPWECYLVPPVGSSIQLGDLLHESGTDKNAPGSYAIVLTPSCDLVCVGDREAKVLELLACRCVPIFLESFKTKRKHLPSFLSQGYYQHLLPLPAFPGEWPNLAGDFRSLLTLSLDDVSSDPEKVAKFTRVASLDSPFRELVSWAFVQHGGKPGLPDRDYESWAESIANPTA